MSEDSREYLPHPFDREVQLSEQTFTSITRRLADLARGPMQRVIKADQMGMFREAIWEGRLEEGDIVGRESDIPFRTDEELYGNLNIRTYGEVVGVALPFSDMLGDRANIQADVFIKTEPLEVIPEGLNYYQVGGLAKNKFTDLRRAPYSISYMPPITRDQLDDIMSAFQRIGLNEGPNVQYSPEANQGRYKDGILNETQAQNFLRFLEGVL
ncbi:MAG: hypothetical protein ACR2LN_01370 [Candidatus Levyibacteriota bacterium]